MPHNLDDYFATETREHLDQLESLLVQPEVPDAARFLRLSTNVRTAAERAGAATVARVAERLEDAASSILTASIAWSAEIRTLAQQTVSDLKLLMRALNRWGPEEERRVRMAIERWDDRMGAIDAGDDPVVPISNLLYDDQAGAPEDGDPPADDPPHAADEVVPIESLLFRGDAALREALALQPAFESIAQGDAVAERPLIELVEELFDLLEMVRADEMPEG